MLRERKCFENYRIVSVANHTRLSPNIISVYFVGRGRTDHTVYGAASSIVQGD